MAGGEHSVYEAHARLLHAHHRLQNPREPFPPRGTYGWRDARHPAIARVMVECERGIDEMRDWVQPVAVLERWLKNLAHKYRSRKLTETMLDDESIDQFAHEMIFGRTPTTRGLTKPSKVEYIGGFLQNPHWMPERTFIESRLHDYIRPPRWVPAGAGDADNDDLISRQLDHADPTVDVEDEALGNVERAERLREAQELADSLAATAAAWRQLFEHALNGLTARQGEQLDVWGIADKVDTDDDDRDPLLADLMRPHARGHNDKLRQRCSRARKPFWQQLARTAGFDNAAEFALALIDTPNEAPRWEEERTMYGELQWDVHVARARNGAIRPGFISAVVIAAVRFRMPIPVPPSAKGCDERQLGLSPKSARSPRVIPGGPKLPGLRRRSARHPASDSADYGSGE